MSTPSPMRSPKDYVEPPPAPVLEIGELLTWSYYRAVIAEFVASMLFLYIIVATIVGHKKQSSEVGGACEGVGLLGISWAVGGMIFVLVYCTAGISGGHINPAVTLGMFLGRKVTLVRALGYMVAQCLGAICGTGLAKGFMKHHYNTQGGGANSVAHGYSKGTALGAEIIGTFFLVYTVFSATDPKRSARDSHIPVLAPLPIGFAVFLVHLATIPITGTGINPARSFGAAVIYNDDKIWDDQVLAVDILGWSIFGIISRCCISSVYIESCRTQGLRFISQQEQYQQLIDQPPLTPSLTPIFFIQLDLK